MSMSKHTFVPERVGYLQIERDGAVATISMDRPEKLNAIARCFYNDLQKVLDLLVQDGRTRVAIITGAGDRAFSAGGDINSFAETVGLEAVRAYQEEAMACFAAVEYCPLTIIAAVNGIAFGGGCELTLACDITIASENAVFAMPETTLGLVPGYGVLRAPDVIGRHMAKLMVAAAERVDAQRALQIGLVQKVVPTGRALDEARAIAGRIASNSPLAIRVGKRLINADINRAGTDYSIEALTVLQLAPDRAEGVAAFLEKRKPSFG